MFRHLKENLRRGAQGVAFGLLGALFLLGGLTFLGAALWMVLAAWQSALFATTVLGLALIGIGAVFMALAASRTGGKRPKRVPSEAMDVASILTAFNAGVEAGKTTRR